MAEPHPSAAEAALNALRERGAHRLAPVRFRYIAALARRAASHQGQARRMLDAKLAQVLADYGQQHAGATHQGDDDATLAASPGQAQPLAELNRHIAQQALGAVGPLDVAGRTAGLAAAQAEGSAVDHEAAPTELKALRYFRASWSQLSVDQQLSQSLAKFPENAGPLNSHRLVLQSLQLMHQLSPAYLHQFMGYVDALLWLDQASTGGASAPTNVVRGEGDKKRKSGRVKAE
jgi:hypothetical protein